MLSGIPPFSLAGCREETRLNLYEAKSPATKKALNFGWRKLVEHCSAIFERRNLSKQFPSTGEEFKLWTQEAAKETLHHLWHSTKTNPNVKVTTYLKATRTLAWISCEKTGKRETPWDINAQLKGYKVTPEWKAKPKENKRVKPGEHIQRDEMVTALGQGSFRRSNHENHSVYLAGRFASYIMNTKGPRTCNLRDINKAGKDHIDWNKSRDNAVITQSGRRRKHPTSTSNNEEIYVGCWCAGRHAWLPDCCCQDVYYKEDGHPRLPLPTNFLFCPLRCLEVLSISGSSNDLFHIFTDGQWARVTEPEMLACNYYMFRGVGRRILPSMFRKGLAMTCYRNIVPYRISNTAHNNTRKVWAESYETDEQATVGDKRKRQQTLENYMKVDMGI